MTVNEAAESLSKKLRNRKWFVAVGVANQTLMLYATQAKLADLFILRDGWEGYKIVRKTAGKVRPAKEQT